MNRYQLRKEKVREFQVEETTQGEEGVRVCQEPMYGRIRLDGSFEEIEC